jgi:hypothetical protein
MYLQGVVTDCYYSGNGHEVPPFAPPRRTCAQSTPQPYYPDGCDPTTTACDTSKAMLLPIEGNNIIIGNVRIRQLRVKSVNAGSSGCYVPDMVRALLPHALVVPHAFRRADQGHRRDQMLF